MVAFFLISATPKGIEMTRMQYMKLRQEGAVIAGLLSKLSSRAGALASNDEWQDAINMADAGLHRALEFLNAEKESIISDDA